MLIRTAQASDSTKIETLHLAAFPEEERELVARLAVRLLAEPASPPTLSLVAETEETLIGHVAYSPMTDPAHPGLSAAILGPLAVVPDRQGQGIGTSLVQTGLAQLNEAATQWVFVYGDPAYYGRFGFAPSDPTIYRPPYPLQHPDGWQKLSLRPYSECSASYDFTCVPALADVSLW